MGGEVHREIERRDGADDAERLADGEGELVLAARGTGKRDCLSLEALGFFCRENQRLVGAPNLAAGIAQGLARFSRQCCGEFLGALAHEVGGLEDDLVALVGRELDLAEGLLGCVDGRTAFCLASDGNLGNGFVRLFIVDRDGLLGHDFLTADVQGLFFHGNTS